MRENARKSGKEIPHETVFCVHLEKYGQNAVIVRTQGTVMQYSSLDDIQKIMKKHLNIEGREVLFPTGEKYENDHYIPSPISDAFNTRNSVKGQDSSLTMRYQKKLHDKRTHDPAIRALKYSLEDLARPLHYLLGPLIEADNALWIKPEHKSHILQAGLTAEYIVNQAGRAYTAEIVRMSIQMIKAGFDLKQATAFMVDGMLQTAITLSVQKYINYQPPLPFVSVQKDLTPFQTQFANQRYYDKVRLHNLPNLITLFADYINILQSFEYYSVSPEGIKNGCTPSQTERHTETKVGALRGFATALKRGGLENKEIEDALKEMQQRIDQCNASLTVDEAKNTIKSLGEKIGINNMSRRDAVLTMALPLSEDRDIFLTASLNETERGVKNITPPSSVDFHQYDAFKCV